MINLDLIEMAITVMDMIEWGTIEKAMIVKDIINRGISSPQVNHPHRQ